MIEKIISGGQTGADRGGLNAGIALGIDIGGWGPKGMIAEDGKIPKIYGLKECPIGGYIARTEQNVIDSDATAIFYYEIMSGGTELTRDACLLHQKPYIPINCLKDDQYNIERLIRWLKQKNPKILNIAGPRSSKGRQWNRSIGHDTQRILSAAIKRI